MATRMPAERAAERGLDRRCARCGYGVATRFAPPRCPMCGSQRWLSQPRR